MRFTMLKRSGPWHSILRLFVPALGSFFMAMAACGDNDGSTGGVAVACSLPFDPGSCDGAMHVFASVNGTCVERVYGGCEGNDNRFKTLEQCMAACEGRPEPNGCPEGRVPKNICLACGHAGGCGESAQVCAKTCTATTECAGTGSLPICSDGVCQWAGCI